MSLIGMQRFIDLVAPESVESYLVASKGWRLTCGEEGVYNLWERSVVIDAVRAGQPDEVFLPLRRDFGDYRRRMQEAVLDLAKAENRPTAGVLYDLLPEDRRADLVRAVFPKLER